MIKAEMNIDAESRIESLLERDDLDLVVVASYSDDHAENSKTLLRKGMTVLSEKPAAKDDQEFLSVVQTAKEHAASYHVFQQYRFSPAYRKIKDVIASGKLGRIVQISLNYDNFARRWDWQTLHDRTAGSLLNTGPHPVDHALDLMGFPEDVSVVCKMDRATRPATAKIMSRCCCCRPALRLRTSRSPAATPMPRIHSLSRAPAARCMARPRSWPGSTTWKRKMSRVP